MSPDSIPEISRHGSGARLTFRWAKIDRKYPVLLAFGARLPNACELAIDCGHEAGNTLERTFGRMITRQISRLSPCEVGEIR